MWRLRATAIALSGKEAQHVRFRRARAPRRAGGTCSICFGKALHKREASSLRCKAVLPRASAGPRFVGWSARAARLCATALVLC